VVLIEIFDLFIQSGITLFGLTSMFLVSRKNKWGFVIGLISQPFYFISSYKTKQWGIFITTFFYTISWIYGIYNWFIKNPEP